MAFEGVPLPAAEESKTSVDPFYLSSLKLQHGSTPLVLTTPLKTGQPQADWWDPKTGGVDQDSPWGAICSQVFLHLQFSMKRFGWLGVGETVFLSKHSSKIPKSEEIIGEEARLD